MLTMYYVFFIGEVMSSITFIISAVITVFVLQSFDDSAIHQVEGGNVVSIQPLSAEISISKAGVINAKTNLLPEMTETVETQTGLKTSSI